MLGSQPRIPVTRVISPMLLCGRIFLDARFRLVTSPQAWARKDYAHEVHTYE